MFWSPVSEPIELGSDRFRLPGFFFASTRLIFSSFGPGLMYAYGHTVSRTQYATGSLSSPSLSVDELLGVCSLGGCFLGGGLFVDVFAGLFGVFKGDCFPMSDRLAKHQAADQDEAYFSCLALDAGSRWRVSAPE